MRGSICVRPEGKPARADYLFKHALVRDALYQSLLSEVRAALHLKIAEEIERRSGNSLNEAAEVLAHHYGQTDYVDKALRFPLHGRQQEPQRYSLDEAATDFAAALALLDKNRDCALDDQVAEFLVSYTLLLNMNRKFNVMIDLLEPYLPRVNCLGDD